MTAIARYLPWAKTPEPAAPDEAPVYEDVDLAIVAESTYPYLRGGVSAVIHDIACANPDRTIGIIHIAWDSQCPAEPAYPMPPHIRWVYPVFLSMNDHVEDFKLSSASALGLSAADRERLSHEVFDTLEALAAGQVAPFWRLYDRALNPRTRRYPLWPLLGTQEFMSAALDRCGHIGLPFTDLFWLLREYFSLACAVAGADYPRARIYHSHTTGYAGLLAALAARQNGGKVLLTEHNLYTRDTINELLDRNMSTVVTARDWRSEDVADVTARCWMAWYIEIGRIIYQAADHITYLYPAAIGEATGLGSLSAKSEIVPNGTLLKKFQAARDTFTERRNEIRQAAAKPKWRLAYCARLVPIKGLVDLISSVAELVDSGETHFQLDVMGHADETPDYANECYDLARKLNLEDYVVFRGNVNMAEVIGEFDLLILPSYNEGQPMVVLEAMAVGLPVIGTPVGGMEQLILSALDEGPGSVPGPCGLLVPAGDVTALADAIRSIMHDQEQYHYFSENSRNRVAQYFELERAMGSYRVIYSRLEGSAAPPRPGEPAMPPRPQIPQQRRRLLLRSMGGRPSATADSGA
jgi:glycosyltransferase involved in cell wall biosynthesis